jgi:hypothetical protein
MEVDGRVGTGLRRPLVVSTMMLCVELEPMDEIVNLTETALALVSIK